MGRGAHPPQRKFLRNGKNQCDIRAKHKNFGKNMICSGKNFVCLRKLRDVWEHFFICPAKFSYFTGMFLVCPEKFSWCVPKKFAGDPPPPPARQHFGGEILMLSLPVRANYTVPPPK
jgi:hypothetical protein